MDGTPSSGLPPALQQLAAQAVEEELQRLRPRLEADLRAAERSQCVRELLDCGLHAAAAVLAGPAAEAGCCVQMESGVYLHVARVEVSVFPPHVRLDPAAAGGLATWVISVEDTGLGRWAVRRGGACLSCGGTWDTEPPPASQDPAWLDGHRFSYAAAVQAAMRHASGGPEGPAR